MWKRFMKKYKEEILLGTAALTAGVISFFVTLNIYPEIKKDRLENDLIETQTNIVSNISDNESKEIKIEEEIQLVEENENNEIPNEEESVLLVEVEEPQEIRHTLEIEQEETNEPEILQEAFAFKEKKLDFIWPLSGDIIRNFASNALVYSETLNEWCTHAGIDIKGYVGDIIVASEEGVIEKIYDDFKFGKTIIISHDNGYKTIYSFVNPIEKIDVGKKVKKGEQIATLLESTNFEAKDHAHLHFEMEKDNQKISPENGNHYIKS